MRPGRALPFRRAPLAACALAVICLLRCDSGDSLAGGASETGNTGIGAIRVETFDAPPPDSVEHIFLEFVRIEAHHRDSGWIRLSDEYHRVDYLELLNGRRAVLAQSPAPAGRYNQLRIYLGAGNQVVINGTTHALSVPGGVSSGLQLLTSLDIDTGDTALLYLDFDASASINWHAGTYSMHPVFKVRDASRVGQLCGDVRDSAGVALRKARILAESGSESGSTLSDESGQFTLVLPPGVYTVTCAASAYPYADTSYTEVTIHSGQTVTAMNFRLFR